MDHFLQSVMVLLLMTVGRSQGSDYISVCYYTSWSAGAKPSIRLPIDEIDPGLCTHLVYAFADLDLFSLKLVPHDAATEDALSGKKGAYANFNLLKERNSNLHTILSVGGESEERASDFATMAKDPKSIRKFANNAVGFLRKRGFDGLDIDWEYPNATTKAFYVQLLKGVREVFDQEAKETGSRRLLLTVAVSPGEDRIKKGYNIPEITKFVDYILIMTYDFFGTWSQLTGFNSPLKERSDPRFSKLYNVDYAVKTWVKGGAEKAKVILGMTGAGVSFTLNDTSDNGVGAAVNGGGTEGALFNRKGRLIYPEICMLLENNDWTREWDAEQQVPYAYKDDQWVGYDDRESIKQKVGYVKENHLGGVMFWELSFDDPRGTYCNEGKFPLLTVAKEELGLESGETPLTKDVDKGVALFTLAAPSVSGRTVFQTVFSAFVCICIFRLLTEL